MESISHYIRVLESVLQFSGWKLLVLFWSSSVLFVWEVKRRKKQALMGGEFYIIYPTHCFYKTLSARE